MLTVNKLLPQGHGLAPALRKRAARVELDWDVRQKSRFDATDSNGRTLGVFLPRGTLVRGGDVLVAEDGSLIAVAAAPQAVMVVSHCTEHGSAFDLLRAAYHLGNRHVALELQPDHLKFEPDHVLADMLRQMHLIVRDAVEAFEPEAGAYAAAGHGHSHAAAAAPAPVRIPVRAAATEAHVHGPDCAHGHAHAHRPDAEAVRQARPAATPASSGGAHDHDHDGDHGHGHGHGQGQNNNDGHGHGRRQRHTNGHSHSA